MVGTLTLDYARTSVLDADGLRLETAVGSLARGRVAHPRFFEGFLTRPDEAAACLLAVANVARTAYYERTDPRLLDPVVTADGEALRFESFSGCGGVHARWDALPGGLDGQTLDHGTTNVDINNPLRLALTRVRPGNPLHLGVGPQDLTVTTMDAALVERKVALPPRWVRGFAEASIIAAGMRPVASVSAAEARIFLRSLPRQGSSVFWVVPAGRGLRVSTAYRPGAACLAAPGRLREMEPLLRYARALTLHAAPSNGGPAASAWQLDLGAGRVVLTLSPELSRGFSGEGGVLVDLAAPDAHVVDRVLETISWAPGADPATIAFAIGEPESSVRQALTVLGTSGLVGFDVATGQYHHRALPFDPTRAAKDNPRLVKARELVDAVARLGDDAWTIDRGDHAQQVRQAADGGWSCTCPWWSQYVGSRGPCSHVLAVMVSERPA